MLLVFIPIDLGPVFGANAIVRSGPYAEILKGGF